MWPVCTFIAIVTHLSLCSIIVIDSPTTLPCHAWVCLPGAESDGDRQEWIDLSKGIGLCG